MASDGALVIRIALNTAVLKEMEVPPDTGVSTFPLNRKRGVTINDPLRNAYDIIFRKTMNVEEGISNRTSS